MTRLPKGPQAMTGAERMRAMRAKKVPGSQRPSESPAAIAAAVQSAPPRRGPVDAAGVQSEPAAPGIGDALAEHEALTATLKARANRFEASAQDVGNYQRALERLADLRAGEVPELTESSMARSPIFARWQRRVLFAVQEVPEALECLEREFAK